MLMSTWHVAVLAVLFACSVMLLFALIVSNFFMRRFGSVYRRFLSVGSPLCPRNVVIIPSCYLSFADSCARVSVDCQCARAPVCPCARVSVCPWIPRVPVCPCARGSAVCPCARVPVCPEGREESNLQYAITIHMIYYNPIKSLLLKLYEIPKVLRVFWLHKKICHFSPSVQAAGLASQRQQGSDSGSLPPQSQGGCWLFGPIGATKLELFRVAPDILVRCCIQMLLESPPRCQ